MSRITAQCTLLCAAFLTSWQTAAQSTDTAKALRDALQRESSSCTGLAVLRSGNMISTLADLYQAQQWQPLWQDPARRAALQRQIRELADDGLEPDKYPQALHAAAPADVCAELHLSSEYLQALEHLRSGRIQPLPHEQPWQAPGAQGTGSPDILALALAGTDDPERAFAQARPQSPLYLALRKAYRDMLGDLPAGAGLPAGTLLRPGMRDARVPLLSAYLRRAAYLSGQSGPVNDDEYQGELAAAVRRFQTDHGLEPDAVVGPLTMAALNLSPQQRRDQARVNLERLRWLENWRDEHLLLVNIAAGEIMLLRGNEVQWQARVQSGRPQRPTPLLVSRIERITLNPSWTIPPTILREDMLPQLRRDPGYFERLALQALDAQGRQLDQASIDWTRAQGISLRQPPGPANPLGKVVFRFANPMAVFLHDTPSQHLFDRSARTFSSGCVRVEDALGLAGHLWSGLSSAERERIATLLATGETHEVPVSSGPQLILAYWTAQAGPDGRMRLLPDPYRRDPALLAAFAGLDPAAQVAAMPTAVPIGCNV
jgi:L,D-transpeptidase YcbB